MASDTAPGKPPGGPKPLDSLCTTKSAANPRSTSAVTDSVAEAANTVMKATSATPMMRAEAVAEVRLGLRAAFSVASLPVTPLSRGRPAPIARMLGLASTGPTMMAPTMMSRAPRPTVGMASVSPSRVHAADRLNAPSASTTMPSPTRSFEAPERSMATSRRAASGGTLVARTAGIRAATSVTPRPMTSAMRTVEGLTTSVDVGRSAPEASRAAVTAFANPMPASMPRAAAIKPTSTASNITEPSTWARPAPTARSRASSRVRCATRMEKVLEMTKMPTSRAMAPKMVSACWKKANPLCTSEEICAAASSPVSTWASAGTAAVTASVSCCWLTPSSAPASTFWIRPSVPAMACTSARVSSTETAPAELSALPKSTVPTSVYCLRPSWLTRVTWSPTSKPASLAAATLRAISSWASGPRPSATS